MKTQKFKQLKTKQTHYDALSIAQYLMTLDPERKYFVNSRMRISETSISAPKIGNVRLNNLLYLCQIFYYLQHKKLLFNEELLAFEHGPIIYSVYNNFWNLYYDTSSDVAKLDARTKKFLRTWFNYFREYSTEELLAIAREDPAWSSTWQKNEDPRIDFTSPQRLNFYEKYFTNYLESTN